MSGVTQAAMPHGQLGRLMGRMMATLNADMERRAVDLAEPVASARLLAIGFGPGVGAAYALGRLTSGSVAGVDPSPVMLAQAMRRVARTGRSADLRLGSAGLLPWLEQSFDVATSVNSIQLWKLPDDLGEVRRVLAHGGRLSVAVHASMLARHLDVSAPEDARDRCVELLETAGFLLDAAEIARARTGPAIYVVARAG